VLRQAYPLIALALALSSCGDVFADLDVRKQAVAEVWFTPTSVFSASTVWLEAHVRLDGGTADVQSHGLTGTLNVKLAFDNLDFFPGTCPENTSDLNEADVAAAAGQPGNVIADTGEYVFCAAIEVGTFEETTELTVGMTFWNGTETVFGTAPLVVNVVPQ
jgi:hypothetical protein